MNDNPMMNNPEGHGLSSEESIQARVEAMMNSNAAAPRAGSAPTQPVRFEQFGEQGVPLSSIEMLMDVNLQLTVELGRTRMSVRKILDLQNGSVVELDRLAGEAVDIFVNDHKLARGEVVVVDDKFGVRITELIAPKDRRGEKA